MMVSLLKSDLFDLLKSIRKIDVSLFEKDRFAPVILQVGFDLKGWKRIDAGNELNKQHFLLLLAKFPVEEVDLYPLHEAIESPVIPFPQVWGMDSRSDESSLDLLSLPPPFLTEDANPHIEDKCPQKDECDCQKRSQLRPPYHF